MPYRAPSCLAAPLSHANQRQTGRLRRARHLFRRGRSIPVVAVSLVFTALSIMTSLSRYQPPGLLLACCIIQGVLLFVVPFPLGAWRLRQAWKAHVIAAQHERLRRELPEDARVLLESDSLIDQEVGLGMVRDLTERLAKLQERMVDGLMVSIHRPSGTPRATPRFNLSDAGRRSRR